MIGPSISGWSPARLGVHQAVEVSGAVDRTELPPYVIRAHDHEVRKALRGKNPFVVLTGTSCTGKTRTAFEAVRAELADLPLFRPLSADDLARRMPDNPTVVWLNEIHHYLVEDAAVVALDAALHLRGLVIVGTTLTDRWSELTEDGSAHPAARQLLVAAHRVEVPEWFDDEALTRLRDAGRHDPRLAYAANAAAVDGKVIQALAGGPELVRAYHDPANAVANAVVTAAIQASLLLDGGPVPVAVVREAAPAYLDGHDRAAGASWFADAEARATAPVHGISALTKSREQPDMGEADHYQAHEFLVQHFRSLPVRQVPAVLWEAMLKHLDFPGKRIALARSAADRGLLHLAARAVHPATRELEGAELMVRSVVQRDHPDHMAWQRAAVELGSETGMWALAWQETPEATVWWQRLVQRTEGRDIHDQLGVLEERGLLDQALQWLAPARDAGSRCALTATLRLLTALRRYDEAVELARPLGGDPEEYFWLSNLYLETGENAKAAAVLTKWAEAGKTSAMLSLADLLHDSAPDDARTWLERAAAAGSKFAIKALADSAKPLRAAELWKKRNRWTAASLFVAGGDVEAAAALWQEEAELGDSQAQHNLAELRMNNGELGEAQRWFRAAARTGEPRHRDALAMFLAKTDRLPEALRLWNDPALRGDRTYLRHRFDAQTRAGRTDEAMTQMTELAEEGSLAAMQLLAEVTSEPDATKWKHRAVRAGAIDIARDLARSHLAKGRAYAAEVLLRSVPSRDRRTEALLREALIAQGQDDEAEQMLRASVERGDERISQLIGFLRTRNRDAEADQASLYGIDVGGHTSEPWSFKPVD